MADDIDNPDLLTQARQKALQLMGQVKQPSMGEVQQSENSGATTPDPNAPTYNSPDDINAANQLRGFKKGMLTSGNYTNDQADLLFPGNYPSQQQVDRQKNIMNMGTGIGSIEQAGAKAAVPLVEEAGASLLKYKPLVTKTLQDTGNAVTNEINSLRQNMTPENMARIRALSQKLYGKVTLK